VIYLLNHAYSIAFVLLSPEVTSAVDFHAIDNPNAVAVVSTTREDAFIQGIVNRCVTLALDMIFSIYTNQER